MRLATFVREIHCITDEQGNYNRMTVWAVTPQYHRHDYVLVRERDDKYDTNTSLAPVNEDGINYIGYTSFLPGECNAEEALAQAGYEIEKEVD